MEATSLVKSTVKQLGKWMVEEVKYLHAVKGKIEGLQSELEWIQCFLRGADEKRTDNEMVRKWISDISDFSYEAEDILEEYLLKVSHPREEGIWNLLKWITCVAGDAESTHQVGTEIDKLTSKISKMTARMINYNVIPTSYENHTSSLSRKAALRRTHSYIPVDDIIGLKNDTADVLNKLMNTEIKTIAIVANPGSGKTTLARKVYHAVKGHQFELCAWIYVSQNPYHLKPCLLHMGNFPEDSEIPTKKLYRMWIAEGIVASSNNNSADLKNIANSYLRELVQRSIVEVGNQDVEGKIKTCRLHDLMWDMCTFKASEVNFLHVLRLGTQDDTKEGSSSNSAIEFENLHRLAIHFGQNPKSTPPCRINKASHLRSLIFFNSGPVNNGCPEWLEKMINRFKLLRILDLENSGMKEVPKEVGSFIHLRYLSIKGTEIRSLPSSIGNLRCLQTLDLRVTLPSHEYQVSGFHKLRITGLSSLETLENFDTKISRVTNLSKLENLRKLSIKDYVSTAETLEIIMACQSFKKKSLVHLALKVDGAILEKSTKFLSSCDHCLHTLEVVGTDVIEPTIKSVEFPHSLVILVIKNCKLMCGIQALSHLRQLKSLSLERVSFSNDYMDCTKEGFSELVDLKLSDMDNLKWMVGKGTMGKLYRLRIFNCTNLTIPTELPTTMHVVCNPCVTRNEEYSVCPFRKVPLVDDDDDDLATRFRVLDKWNDPHICSVVLRSISFAAFVINHFAIKLQLLRSSHTTMDVLFLLSIEHSGESVSSDIKMNEW